MRLATHLLTMLTITTIACGDKPEKAKTEEGNQMPGDTGIAGMQMTMQGMQMMPAMRAHLDSVAAMTPPQMSAAMSNHEDLASRTMDAMGADMRGMNMVPDSTWTSLTDSLRRDLADLLALSGDALKSRMETHAGRMRRMMEMHEQMMKM